MANPYIGEIKMFAGPYAPRGYALCDGRALQIAQNDALFSLIGTIYGGDGVETFNLPDLQGRIPIHKGQGTGLSPRPIGQKAGAETVTLMPQTLAAHTHGLLATGALGSQPNPEKMLLAQSRAVDLYYDDVPSAAMSTSSVTPQGGGQPHDNVMPYQCITFIIALEGIYPTRN